MNSNTIESASIIDSLKMWTSFFTKDTLQLFHIEIMQFHKQSKQLLINNVN